MMILNGCGGVVSDEVLPAAEGVVLDVKECVVEDASPVVFGAESAGHFDELFAQYGLAGVGVGHHHPN